jgi:hypothetical protein
LHSCLPVAGIIIQAVAAKRANIAAARDKKADRAIRKSITHEAFQQKPVSFFQKRVYD